ncbi:unnamed protein product [Cladocopium goreaui]|uniref:BPI fold-containing family C protein n=1 Tax=Cladocopium goreaui TaxID=2562237 RepID=A0A9P1G579_9DINO|nr:unnamed protein product [Cladocopium goreaui]
MPVAQNTLKATQSASALKAAACATLNDTGYVNNATMKLSPQGNRTILPNKNVTTLKPIETVWDEEHDDQKMHEQKRKLRSMASRLERMAGVFEEETRARQEQRRLMDELHGEQMQRIDEIEEELDQAMAELKAYIDEFMRKFRQELDDTFTALFSELQVQVELITPRIAAIEARGRVLRNGIDEEKQDRIRHYAEILVPVKVNITIGRDPYHEAFGFENNAMATSQEEMCRYFLPILREKGTRVKKNGMRLARPARPDEEVLTIVNGEVVARSKATESGSMVIRQESADHEFYLLGPEKFAKNYDLPGIDITEAGASFDQLRQRNFKYFRRKGELLLYQVTEEDMTFVPTGKFEVAFSTSPVPLCSGDYLVTALPLLSEVWVSKHSVIYEDGGLGPQPSSVTCE